MQKEEFLKRIKSAFDKELPGVKAHEKMSPINRPIDISTISNIHDYRHSAVALICYPSVSGFSFVLIQRPTYEGNHSGQISFPGGKKEESDLDLEFTARRETFEEIGVELNQNHLVGKLTTVFIPVSKFIIEPFLYVLNTEPHFRPDTREVESIFSPLITDLIDDGNTRNKAIELSTGMKLKNVPYFALNDKDVWGATALILSEFKEILKYNH